MKQIRSWSLKQPATTCCISGVAFQQGDIYYTAIFIDPDSKQYIRRDYCASAWQQDDLSALSPQSYWSSRYNAKDLKKKKETDSGSIDELLTRLIEEDDESTLNTRYILCLMLERQKWLKEVNNYPTSQGLVRVYQQKKSNALFLIIDPELSPQQLTDVQDHVQLQLLHLQDKLQTNDT